MTVPPNSIDLTLKLLRHFFCSMQELQSAQVKKHLANPFNEEYVVQIMHGCVRHADRIHTYIHTSIQNFIFIRISVYEKDKKVKILYSISKSTLMFSL